MPNNWATASNYFKKHIDVCNTTMDLTFFKQQGVTGMSLRVFEISQLLNTRSSTQSSASVVTINRVFVFCFLYVTLSLSFQYTKFNSLQLPGNIMNGTKLIPWCCKSMRLRKIICTVVLISKTLKKKLNVNCDKWTNVGESMWKGSLRLNDVCHCLRFTNPDF